MRRLLVGLLLVTALLPAGCAPPRSGSLGPAPTAAPPSAGPAASSPTAGGTTPPPAPATSGPVPASPTAPPGTTSAPAGTVSLELWFVRDGRLTPTRRTRPSTLATSRLALTELAAGPTRAESAAGLATLLPVGAEPLGVTGGVATVRLPTAAGDTATQRLRQAQVVWTLTQFPTVRRVRFDPPAPDAGPVDRADYADLLPPIVVTAPVIGQRITGPVTVTGTADVFEATVSVRLLDAGGREIATTFTTASCGSGCRGDYRTTLPWAVTEQQRGTVEVYEVSARDGTRINVVAVPVTLAPAAR